MVTADDPDLQIVLVMRLVDYGLGLEASKWMRHFGLQKEDMPAKVRNDLARAETRQASNLGGLLVDAPQPNSKIGKPPPNTYALNFKQTRLEYVNDAATFEEMCNLLRGETVIAIDTEFKSNFNEAVSLGLMQVAIKKHVFVIDMVVENVFTEAHWKEFSDIFNNIEVIKLGFGFQNDLIMLQKHASIKITQNTARALVDVQNLWLYLDKVDEYREALQPYRADHGNGLKDLVKEFLFKTMTKSFQFSNWGMRPLSAEQIHYAAADAYSLIEVYDVFNKRFERFNINLNDVISEFQSK